MSIKRWAAKVDANQEAIVAALRLVGCSVEIIGRPVDLLVGYRMETHLLEVKDEGKPPSARKLTPAQEAFFRNWHGRPARVVESIAQAFEAIGVTVTHRRDAGLIR